jgi:hypothetical protein
MAWVYAFWALGAVACLAAIVDVVAIVGRHGRSLPTIALGLKSAVVAAFVVWWVYFNLIATGTTMEDLAVFAGILVVSVPVLIASAVLDALTVRALLVHRKES